MYYQEIETYHKQTSSLHRKLIMKLYILSVWHVCLVKRKIYLLQKKGVHINLMNSKVSENRFQIQK